MHGLPLDSGDDTDMGLFSAVEVINYGEVMFSSAKYWDSELRAGHRLAAIGGSDNHNATIPPEMWGPSAAPVEADDLSVRRSSMAFGPVARLSI